MANVSLERVTKRFSAGTVAVDDVSLEIFDREFLVLVGPSGCGKSTTLRLIAGLEACTSGSIRIGQRVVDALPPRDRDVAMVFQSDTLVPHLTVRKNLSFGLKFDLKKLRNDGGVLARGLRKIFQPRRADEPANDFSDSFTGQQGGIDEQVRRTAVRLGIEHLLDRKPHQLSGGERQRVALGRAIVREPAAFLFDEPLSSLDIRLRQQMQQLLRRLHDDLQTTMIYVTHDQVEAMALGDRIAVMDGGRILQVGRPLDVYQQPANLFVAGYIGQLPMNFVSGTVQLLADRFRFCGDGLSVEWGSGLSFSQLRQWFESRSGASQSVVLGFRAEDVRLVEGSDFDGQAVVSAIDQLGESTSVHLRTEKRVGGLRSVDWTVRLPSGSVWRIGQRVKLKIDLEKVVWFDSQTGQNLLKEVV